MVVASTLVASTTPLRSYMVPRRGSSTILDVRCAWDCSVNSGALMTCSHTSLPKNSATTRPNRNRGASARSALRNAMKPAMPDLGWTGWRWDAPFRERDVRASRSERAVRERPCPEAP